MIVSVPWLSQELSDGQRQTGTSYSGRRSGSVESAWEAAVTHAEQRIVEFLIHSNATELADLPDWFLALVEGDGGSEPSQEMITAASLLYVRRQRPGIEFGAAQRLLASYASDPERLDELMKKIQAFRLSCGFERLKRGGTLRSGHDRRPVRPGRRRVGDVDRGRLAVFQFQSDASRSPHPPTKTLGARTDPDSGRTGTPARAARPFRRRYAAGCSGRHEDHG